MPGFYSKCSWEPEKVVCVLVFKCFRIVAKIVQRVLIILFTRVPPVLTSYIIIAQSSKLKKLTLVTMLLINYRLLF